MKFRRFLSLSCAAFIFLAVTSRGDVILEWNALMLDAIRADNTAPTTSTRNLAILHTAIYDAVNSITRTHQPYLILINAPTNSSPEAAVVAAAYQVTQVLYPSFSGRSDDMYQQWISSAVHNAALTNGLSVGEEAALVTLDSRSDDGSSTELPYIPSNAPGQWQRTPPFFRPPLTPQWGYVETFCLPDIEPFVSPLPPALNTPEYAASVNEVKAIGGKNSSVRTSEQSQIAVFWSDFSYTAMPPGHWHEIAATIAQTRGNNLEENARLFALISIAQADAGIVCWESKYRYNLWRPITAIQRADEDGNPATDKDATWDHYLAAPPFPSYTSGHSTFSKASAQVLTHFYNTDAINFTATSDSLPGVFRSFTSLTACADEIGISRIYGGIHYPFDNEAGKICGKKIGDYVSANFLLPNAQLPQVKIEGMSNGIPQLRVQGHIGSNCVLQISANLNTWTSISTNSATVGGVTIYDVATTTNASRFYRVMEP